MGNLWLGLFTLLQPAFLCASLLPSRGLSTHDNLEFAEVYLEKFYNYKPVTDRQRRAAEPDSFKAIVQKDDALDKQNSDIQNLQTQLKADSCTGQDNIQTGMETLGSSSALEIPQTKKE